MAIKYDILTPLKTWFIEKTNIKTSFGDTPTDTDIPSEKLVKNSLDTKIDKSSIVTTNFDGSDNNHVVGAKALADELKVVKETIPTSFTSSDITDWATATSNFEVITNKKTTLDNADDTHYPTTKTVKDNLDTKVSGSKITSINSTSSDTEIPTAKAVYELYNSVPKWEVKSVASIDALMGITGEAGKIYLVANNGSGSNAFDEYFWNDSLEVPAFEKFGSIDVDITDLVTMPQVKNYINSNLSVSLPSTGADAGKLIIELN